jgi:transposase
MVAELYVVGTSRDEMAAELDCHTDTITAWVKDPRVQAHARRFAIERVNRISRRIDSAIEARLADLDAWTVKELMLTRREYLERPLKINAGEGEDQAATTNEIAEAMDQDPDFAAQLAELVNGQKKG